jgi:hypothetical protein
LDAQTGVGSAVLKDKRMVLLRVVQGNAAFQMRSGGTQVTEIA